MCMRVCLSVCVCVCCCVWLVCCSLFPYLAIQKRMQQIMMFCFNSVKSKLPTNSGEFELLGFDFLIDDLLKVGVPETE